MGKADGNPGGPRSPEQIRQDARNTLTKVQQQLDDYSKALGKSLDEQMSRTFAHLSYALDEKTTATSMVKSGLAVMIENCKSNHDLYNAAYKIWFPG